MSEENNIITLSVNGTDIAFEPTLTAYNQCLNDAAKKNNVTGALRDYLMKTVQPECREALGVLLKRPGMVGNLANALNEAYAPDVDIQVKK